MKREATTDTPLVDFDAHAGCLLIKGRSLPEDAWSFYKPIIEWASALSLNASNSLTVEFFLEYFNSSSGRYLLELLSTLEKEKKEHVKVVWVSEPDDDLMQEKGEEFESLLDLPFEFKTIS